MAKKFITIKEDSYDEFVEKKSTFITHLIRINNEEEAREFIQKIKKKHYDATHVCSCYVYGDNNEITRANDDGEPSGTAGAPMLDVLVKNEIKNVCATVIRYYGGTKLGTGGLVRAYGGEFDKHIQYTNLDFAVQYVRGIFSVLGIDKVKVIRVEGLDLAFNNKEQLVKKAIFDLKEWIEEFSRKNKK